jgi:molybdate transport system ATP-binding protein
MLLFGAPMSNDPSPTLQLELRHSFGALQVDAGFVLRAPGAVLFGPSGAGKTTILRAIAGLLRPDHCRIVLGSDTLVDTARGLLVPPERRRIGFVTQRPALFPHLSVTQNVAFGLQHLPRAAREERVDEMLSLFEAEALRPKRVANLSGGEKQRVALARALAPEPRVLLLDEPLAGMDTALKEAVLSSLMPYLKSQSIPLLYVTHELPEVFQLGVEVIVLRNGRIEPIGSAAQVLARERDRLLRQLEGCSMPS